MRTVLKVAVLVLVFASFLGGFAAQAQQGRPLDIDRYCKLLYGNGSSAVMLNRGDAYSWRCNKVGNLVSIDMNNVCQRENGQGYQATVVNRADAYSWQCVAGSTTGGSECQAGYGYCQPSAGYPNGSCWPMTSTGWPCPGQ